MDKDYIIIGEYIRTLRDGKGMTQAELAEKTDLTDSYICRVERGQKKIGMQAFLRILQALGTGIKELVLAAQKETEQLDLVLNRCKVLFSDCSDAEKALLMDMLENIKDALRKNQYKPYCPDTEISESINS